MALSRTQVYTSNNRTSAAGTISITSGSFTPPANSLLVLVYGYENSNSAASDTGVRPILDSRTTGVSGGGLTWTKRLSGEAPQAGFSPHDVYTAVGEVWTAPVGGSPSSMTVTVTNGATVGGDPPRCLMEIEAYTGYDTATPIGATASVSITHPSDGSIAYSLTLSANPASTSIVQSGAYVETDGSNHQTTNGTGWTEIFDSPSVDDGYGQMQGQVRTGSTSTSVAWADLSATETLWGTLLYALEIREAGGAAPFVGINRRWLPGVLQAWVPPDPPPKQARELPPSLMAVRVDDPPFNDREVLPHILSAWVRLDPLPTLTRDLPPAITAVQVDNPPFTDREVLSHTLSTWVRLDPLPTIPEKVPQPFVPFVGINRRWLPGVLQAWAQPDPQPVQARDLPPAITAVQVDNPPFTDREVLSHTLSAWVRLDPLPTLPEKLPQPFVQLFVGINRQWLSGVLQAWAQPDPQPVQARDLPPAITAVQVDNPPFTDREVLSHTLSAWVRLDPLPTLPEKLPQPFVQLFVGINRQWLSGVLQAWAPADPQPTQGRELPPAITAVQVDNPPFSSRELPPWQAWVPPDPQPTLNEKLIQAFVPVIITDPPFSARRLPHWPMWTPPDPQPTLPRQLPPSITAVRVDNPPFSQRAPLPGILASWIDPPAAPTQAERLSPGIPGQSVDNPPRLRAPVISPAWQQQLPDPLPQLGAKLPQGTAVIRVVYEPAWLSGVLQAWVSIDPLPTRPRQLPPVITAVRVDNPPIHSRRVFEEVYAQWEVWKPVFQPHWTVTESGAIVPPVTRRRRSHRPPLEDQDNRDNSAESGRNNLLSDRRRNDS